MALTALLALATGVATGPSEEPVRDDEASAVRLVWDAPTECSDAATMQARLDEAMKLQLDDVATRQRWVIARVRKDGESWTLRLWVAPEGALSERALTETSCAELERATLTIVAMLMPPVMVELDATPPPSAGDMEPPPKAEAMGAEELEALIADAPEPEAPPPDPGGPDMEPPAASKLRGAVGFSGGFGRGTMPAGAGGFAITTALLIPNGRFELVGNFWSTRNIGLPAAPDARARYRLLSAALRGCGAPRISKRIEVPACGGIEVGSVLAEVDGAALLHGPGQAVALLGADSGVHVLLAPSVALKFVAHGWVALRRAQHRALDSTLSTSDRFGYRFSGGIEFRFGGAPKARALKQ
ncbi:MAG: hypothetical protein ACE37F_02455 [Nannocystaceae bacterium]|nr:hypothetical protein [bacterium]